MTQTHDARLWREAGRVFGAALETAPDDVDALLAAECNGNGALAAAVRRLLLAHAQVSTMEDARSIAAIAGDLVDLRSDAILSAGAQVGDFTIERLLGHGGMGHVYLARREIDGHAQRVALKVAAHRYAGEALLQRLRRERRILSTLEHPNIARLIDLGELPDGRPYYAMEYVDGLSIANYCATRQLSLAARLRLFLGVCEAVAYAHRRLVLHRDLKSDNVLVDGDGRPRLLDFGIAKPMEGTLLAGDLTDDSGRFFSPASAAPEQIRGRPTTVGTDVYGLGCLLYEMLAGVAPFARGELMPLAFQEVILERDAPLPSMVTTTSGGIEARLLRGDPDAIVARCLRKRAEDRYLSVEALTADVRAMLESRPTAVRSGERWYRIARFVRRHRTALTLGALTALLVVGFTTITLLQAQRLRDERDSAVQAHLQADAERARAQTIVDFLIESFKYADPTHSAGRLLKAEELLTSAARLLPLRLHGQPEAMAAAAQTLATLFFRIELFDAGRAQAKVARDVLGALTRAPLSLRMDQFLIDGMEAFYAADYAREEALADAGLALAAQNATKVPVETLYRLWQQKSTSVSGYDVRRALTEYDRGIEALRAAGSPPRWIYALKAEKARTLNGFDREERIEAKRLLQEVLAWQDVAVDANDIDRLGTTAALAKIEERLQDYGPAEEHIREVLSRQIQIYGADSATVGRSKNTLANVLSATGRLDEADDLYHEALRIVTARMGEADPFAAGLHYNLGLFYFDQMHDEKRAEEEYREALRLLPVRLGAAHLNVALCRFAYSVLLLAQHRYGEAETQIDAALPTLEKLGPDDSSVHDIKGALAIVRMQQGRRKEAADLIALALPGLKREREPTDRFLGLVEAVAAQLK